jgi:hypothetical protein
MRTWVKLHTKVLMNPKMHRLTDHQYRACINLFALGGTVDRSGELGTVPDIAYYLRLDEADTLTCLSELAKAGIVSDKKGMWSLLNWCEYQSNSPSSENGQVRERVKKHRENKAKDAPRNEDVTPLHPNGNDTRTEQIREEEEVEEIREEESVGAVAPAPKPLPEPLPAQAEVFEKNGGKWPSGKLVDGTSKKQAAIQFMVEHVPDVPADLAFWGKVVFEYQRQWSPKSYTVMVNDYFLRRRLPGGQSAGTNGNGAQAQSKYGGMLAYLEELEHGNGA